ncbi:MAG: hypothetical protein MJ094_01250 [Saccharofermentans sp.]|nr:hypothetical protein [Saccharofermentans sp.]
MKKAIDNYAIGKQIEVEAWEGTSIAANTRRFFCPECMESVALDIRGFFRHKNKTPQSIECDKRVDSPTKSSYEKMGLPLYLTQDIDSIFRLYMGFHPLPELLIKNASKSGGYIEIISRNIRNAKIYITEERFNPEHITKVALDCMPSSEGKYEIEYHNVPTDIQNRWTKYSDAFFNGSFFKVGEQFSRKIRILGTLTTNTQYYYVGSILGFYNFRDCMEIKKIGSLKIGLQSLDVYIVEFKKTYANDRRFQSLADYLLDYYHLNLLLGESELLPIWPPCISDDNYLIYPYNTYSGLFLVDSPNENPNVYKYSDKNYQKLEITKTQPPILCLSFSENSIPISVDKTFNGNIQFIQRQQVDLFSGMNVISILDTSGNPIQNFAIKRINNMSIAIRGNTPCQVFHIKNNGVCIEYALNKQAELRIDGVNNNDSLIALTRHGIELLNHIFEAEKKESEIQQRDQLLAAKLRGVDGMIVPIDNTFLHLYQKYKELPETKRELEHYKKSGSVPVNVMRILYEYLGGKK